MKKYLTTNLQNYLNNELNSIYEDALEYVRQKTGLSVDFPEQCSYTLDQLLDKKWFN